MTDAKPLSAEFISGTLLPNTDDAPASVVLDCVRQCAQSWVPETRLIGNIRAGDIRRACSEALATITEQSAQIAVLVEAAETAFGHIDDAMGDTDPSDEYDPLLLASQALAPFVGDAPDLPAAAKAYMEEVEGLREFKQDAIEFDEIIAPEIAIGTLPEQVAKLLKRAEAAEAEVAKLRASQRTPGTVEVCAKCRLETPPFYDGECNAVSDSKNCPLRIAQEKK